MLLPLLTAALLAADSLPEPPPREGAGAATPAISVHRQPAIPLVALRVALLAADPPGYAGAGHLVQHLVHSGLAERAALVGGRVQIERTADAVVFTLTGPAAELGYLAEILRTALRPGLPAEGALLRASRELAEERLAEWETAERHVRSALRVRLFPADVSAAGTELSAARLAEGDAVRRAWAQMYRPERVTITAVGDVTLDQIRAAFGDLPPAADVPPGRVLRDTVSAAPLAPAEATRAWVGAGFAASGIDPAVLSVVTRIAGNRLRQRLPGATLATGEHWWTHHGQALVLIASVPGARLAEAQRAVGATLTGAAGDLTEAEVAEAARAIRRELLFYSRTPDRMAALLGQFWDRTGDPDEGQRFYDRLGTVSLREVRQALNTLAGRTPARVDVPPQRLMRR